MQPADGGSLRAYAGAGGNAGWPSRPSDAATGTAPPRLCVKTPLVCSVWGCGCARAGGEAPGPRSVLFDHTNATAAGEVIWYMPGGPNRPPARKRKAEDDGPTHGPAGAPLPPSARGASELHALTRVVDTVAPASTGPACSDGAGTPFTPQMGFASPWASDFALCLYAPDSPFSILPTPRWTPPTSQSQQQRTRACTHACVYLGGGVVACLWPVSIECAIPSLASQCPVVCPWFAALCIYFELVLF